MVFPPIERSWPRVLTVAGLALAGCTSSPPDGADAARTEAHGEAPAPRPAAPPYPYVRVVGTAQDGGLPHVACRCERCQRARREPEFARHVAGLAVVTAPGRVWLVDATPDLRAQLDLLEVERDAPEGRVDRSPLDGVLLTHAHLGHYTGLAFLGFEAAHVQGLPVHATPAMTEFLATHAPWSQLVSLGNVTLRPTDEGRSVDLGGGVHATPFRVPHRNEFADTVGWRITGPKRTLLYVPDTDRWEGWDPPIESRIDSADVALLDGTFYSTAELPGRDVSSIGHPRIVDSMDRLQTLADAGKDVAFIHLNHSNPALAPESEARKEIERRGFRVAADAEAIGL